MAQDPAAPRGERMPATGFEVVRKGYDQGQVDAHLRNLDARLRILLTDREAAVDQAEHLARELEESRGRTERLRAQVRTMVEAPQSVQGMSERMRSMLRLAEDEAGEMLTQAQNEVDTTTAEARQQAEQMRADAWAEAEAIQTDARSDADEVRAAARAEVEQMRSALAAERADLSAQRDRDRAEAARQRAELEEDFTLAMDQRRSEALADLTAQRMATRQAAEELRAAAERDARQQIDAAHEQAIGLVRAAERRIEDLQGLRRRIQQQLQAAQATLGRSLLDLEPLAETIAGPTTGRPTSRAEALPGAPAAVDGVPTSPARRPGEGTGTPEPAGTLEPAGPVASDPGPDPRDDGSTLPRRVPSPTRRADLGRSPHGAGGGIERHPAGPGSAADSSETTTTGAALPAGASGAHRRSAVEYHPDDRRDEPADQDDRSPATRTNAESARPESPDQPEPAAPAEFAAAPMSAASPESAAPSVRADRRTPGATSAARPTPVPRPRALAGEDQAVAPTGARAGGGSLTEPPTRGPGDRGDSPSDDRAAGWEQPDGSANRESVAAEGPTSGPGPAAPAEQTGPSAHRGAEPPVDTPDPAEQGPSSNRRRQRRRLKTGARR